MAQNWQNFQLAIDIGDEGTYDTTRAIQPCVIKDGSVYRMWYTGNDNNKIIYCDSNDGTNWSNHQKVIDEGSEGTYDTSSAYHPCVIKDGSTYKMWYGGFNGVNGRTIYATSNDGINWSNFQMVLNVGSQGVYDTQFAYNPWVIKDDTIYKMWYSAYNGSTWRIVYATSSNGTAWSNFQLAMESGAEGTYDTSRGYLPTVIKIGSFYKMWYTGYDGSNFRLLYADSSNGILWNNHQLVLDLGSEGTYDTSSLYSPSVIKDDSTYKMWYTGNDGSTWRILNTNWAASFAGGTLNDSARIIVINESDWTIDSNNVYSTGSYSLDTVSGTKLIIARRETDGEIIAYGNVTPTI